MEEKNPFLTFPLIYRITDPWVCQTLNFLNICVIENFTQVYHIYIFPPQMLSLYLLYLLFYTHAHLYIHHTQSHLCTPYTHINNTQTHAHNLLSLWNFDPMYVRFGLTSWDWIIIRELVPLSIAINCLQLFTSVCGPGKLPHPCETISWFCHCIYLSQVTMWLRFHDVSSCHKQNTLSHNTYPGPLTLKLFRPLLFIIYFINFH